MTRMEQLQAQIEANRTELSFQVSRASSRARDARLWFGIGRKAWFVLSAAKTLRLGNVTLFGVTRKLVRLGTLAGSGYLLWRAVEPVFSPPSSEPKPKTPRHGPHPHNAIDAPPPHAYFNDAP